MIRMENIFQKLDDMMNPIAVKELRQAVQSRFITATLMLFLLGQLAAMGLYLMNQDDFSLDSTGGGQIYEILFYILAATCILFIPGYTGVRMSAERSDNNMDLLFVTTISAWKIIRGKMAAAAILTILISSVCLPFMTFSYLLRGIDLPTIFFQFGIVLIATFVVNQFVVFLAAIRIGGFFRLLLGLATLIVMFMVMQGVIGMSFSLRYGLTDLSSWDFWAPFLTTVSCILMLTGFFHVVSVAMLMPPSSNRVLILRTYITLMWLISGALAVTWSIKSSRSEPIMVWTVGWTMMFAAWFFIAVSEREELGARIRRKIPRNWLLRLPTFIFYSGSASGVTWCAIMIVASIIGLKAWIANHTSFHYSSSDLDDALVWIVAFPLYVYAYSMTAVLIRKVILRDRMAICYTGIMAVFLMAFGCCLPLVAGFLTYREKFSRIMDKPGWWSIVNPFMMFVEKESHAMSLASSSIWAIVITLMSLPWFAGQIRRFKPLSEQQQPQLKKVENG